LKGFIDAVVIDAGDRAVTARMGMYPKRHRPCPLGVGESGHVTFGGDEQFIAFAFQICVLWNPDQCLPQKPQIAIGRLSDARDQNSARLDIETSCAG